MVAITVISFVPVEGGSLKHTSCNSHEGLRSRGWFLSLVYLQSLVQHLANGSSVAGWEITRSLFFISHSHRI